MRRYGSLVVLLLGLALALAVACGSGKSTTAQKVGNPPAPTPGTPNPAYRIRDVNDAVRSATRFIAGEGGSMLGAREIQSVMYVQSTVGQVGALLGATAAPWVPDRLSPVPAGTTAWLFVARGLYTQLPSAAPGVVPTTSVTPPAWNTLWVVATVGGGVDLSGLTAKPLAIAQLGTPVLIPPGQVPQIDAKRAPAVAPAPTSPAATPTP